MTDEELKSEVRILTGYDQSLLSDDDLTAVVGRAKSHISAKQDLADDFDWYAESAAENALFWWTALFAKVTTGELDAQDVQIGAINIDSLLANDDGTATLWFQNAKSAMQSMQGGGESDYGWGVTGVQRENRAYGSDESGTTDSDLGQLGG